MNNSSRTGSLRQGRPIGKVAAAAWTVLVCFVLPACGLGGRIRLADLERAPRVMVPLGQRALVGDATALQALCTSLGPRLGLLQVKSAADWARLVQAVPGLGPCPDLRTGMVVGVACWAGTPLDGHWPLRIDGVRLHRGAGLLEAHFQGGTFLPDGAMALETAYVPGLVAVLAADVDGATFCP